MSKATDDFATDGGSHSALPAFPPGIVETDALVQQIQILSRTQCDVIEAAAFLGFTPDEFKRFLLSNKRSFHAWFSGAAAGRATLKMSQFKAAQKGSEKLLTFLGKQYLGQSDAKGDGRSAPAASDSAWDNLSSWRMTKLA